MAHGVVLQILPNTDANEFTIALTLVLYSGLYNTNVKAHGYHSQHSSVGLV